MHDIAVIGCGYWAEVVVKNIKKNHKLNFKYLVCRNKKNSTKFNKITKFTNINQLISKYQVDGIYAAAEPKTNLSIVKFAYQKKIPCIIEKPMATNTKDAKKIYDYAYKKKLPIFLNQSHLYDNKFLQLSKFVKEKGKIKKIFIIEGGKGPFRKNIHPIWDWGIHAIASLIKITGDGPYYKITKKDLKKKDKHGKKGLVSKINIQLKSGLVAKIITGNLLKEKTRIIKVIFFNETFVQYNFITGDCFYFQNNKRKNFNANLNFNQSTLQTLLNKFANSIENKFNNFDLDILKISLSSIIILEKCFPIK